MKKLEPRETWTAHWEPEQWWGSPQVRGARQAGEWLLTYGWKNSMGILKRGDVIIVSCCPDTRPLELIVTRNVFSDSLGNSTIPVSPPIEHPGPANGALVTIVGRRP